MAFVPLTNSQVASGQPVTTDLWTTSKDNQIDHETRILSLEGSLNFFNPHTWNVRGAYGQLTTIDNIDGIRRVIFTQTVNAVRLYIKTAGNSGSTEIDIKRKVPSGSFESILTTRASVPSSSGDEVFSINAILDATKVDLPAGTILRCDLTAVQGGDKLNLPRSFDVFVEYIKT